jgi:hypothetical protein
VSQSADGQLSKVRKLITVGHELGFHEDTKIHSWVVNFIFSDEGMGGFVNWTGAIVWIARNCPWVVGRVFALKPLMPLIQDVLKEFPEWEVFEVKHGDAYLEAGTMMCGSNYTMGGHKAPRQLLQPLGSHPFDVAFGYFLGTCPAPQDAYLPILDYPSSRLQPKLRRLEGRYVVFPAGGTTFLRTLTGAHLNPLIAHVKAKGLTPVFLGAKDGLANNGNATLPDDIDFEGGIDLRSQTSLKEAALIMQHATCTVGIDGGLLHLAALMKDSRVVFGYNITSVGHRVPRRTHGKTINVYLKNRLDNPSESEELRCSPCQSKWKHTANHNYSHCYYAKGQLGWDEKYPERENGCMKLLFENNGERWKRAIDEVLG